MTRRRQFDWKTVNDWAVLIIASILVLIIACKAAVRGSEPSEHLTLGSPSQSPVANLDYRITKSQYVVSYNQSTTGPNWVAWHLSKDWLGHAERQNDFRADDSLPISWFHAKYSEYAGSGFDSGHQCPSDDRTKTIADNQATFLMTNMVPQAPAVNRGTWKALESHCRQLVGQGNELYLVAGPHGAGGHGTKGFASKLADKRIVVPAACWKVAVILPDKSGDDLARVDKDTKTLAVVMPNVQTIESDWTTYAVSVRDVEELTGLDFFSLVPTHIQEAIETTK